MVVWKAQGVPQSNDAAYPMYQEETAQKQTT